MYCFNTETMVSTVNLFYYYHYHNLFQYWGDPVFWRFNYLQRVLFSTDFEFVSIFFNKISFHIFVFHCYDNKKLKSFSLCGKSVPIATTDSEIVGY